MQVLDQLYISEIACLCIFCRQTYRTAVVVVQGMRDSRGRAAIKAGNINNVASNLKTTDYANTGRRS